MLVVYTTFATEDDALRVARDMVSRKLAACAQIEPITSVYVWEGALQQEGEFRVAFKTTKAAYGALEAALKAAHPYTLPMILALPAASVEPAYAAWVAENTAP
ncbi:MAG: divalent-cation tolerance protein CutA [Proteobacteria bacterium]|nr:divalent-cation tolerance protein CutA [Pseudomonadota bacterium]